MATLQERIEASTSQLETDSDLLHDVVHGDSSTTVTTEGGPVKSLAKSIADMEAEYAANAVIAEGQQHLDDAYNWANRAEDNQYTDGDARTGYSAFHWAQKSEGSAQAAEQARDEALAYKGLVNISENDTTPGTLEQKLLVGEGLSASTQNNGADETRTVGLNINGLTADESPDTSADYTVVYDDSAATHKKVRLSKIGTSGGVNPYVSAEFIADDTADTLSVGTDDGFANDDEVFLKTSGTFPGGLDGDTVYFVVNATANTLQLSLTSGGAVIDITSAGTGTHKVFTIEFVPVVEAGSLIVQNVNGQKALKFFESSEITVASGSQTYSVSHGLGATPKSVQAVIVCTAADRGYSVGDEIDFNKFFDAATATWATWANATTVGAVQTLGINVTNKDASTAGVINYSNWKLVLRAWG